MVMMTSDALFFWGGIIVVVGSAALFVAVIRLLQRRDRDGDPDRDIHGRGGGD